jgi:structural maintenance of chromosome 1
MEEVRDSCPRETSTLMTSRQNLRDEVAMDVDEEDEAGHSTQRPRRVPDYGIEVDFDILGEDERGVRGMRSMEYVTRSYQIWIREQDSSGEALGEFDASIAKLNAEIERMTPNMKAMDRYVSVLPGIVS